MGSANVVLASDGHVAVEGLTQKQAQQTVDAVEDDVYTSSHDQTGGNTSWVGDNDYKKYGRRKREDLHCYNR